MATDLVAIDSDMTLLNVQHWIESAMDAAGGVRLGSGMGMDRATIMARAGGVDFVVTIMLREGTANG